MAACRSIKDIGFPSDDAEINQILRSQGNDSELQGPNQLSVPSDSEKQDITEQESNQETTSQKSEHDFKISKNTESGVLRQHSSDKMGIIARERRNIQWRESGTQTQEGRKILIAHHCPESSTQTLSEETGYNINEYKCRNRNNAIKIVPNKHEYSTQTMFRDVLNRKYDIKRDFRDSFASDDMRFMVNTVPKKSNEKSEVTPVRRLFKSIKDLFLPPPSEKMVDKIIIPTQTKKRKQK